MLRIFWMFLILMCVAVIGCTPDQIEAVQAQAEYQLTDSASQVQQAAEAIGTAADYAKPAAALFPGAPWILVGLTTISGLCNLLLKLRVNKQTAIIDVQKQAITEIVKGGQDFKSKLKNSDNQYGDQISADFKQAQAAAQSTSTKLIVAAEKVKAA